MSTSFDYISIFAKLNSETQLRLLSQFVMEPATNIIQSDIDKFDYRLIVYAEKAKISELDARKKVCASAKLRLGLQLQRFGIDFE